MTWLQTSSGRAFDLVSPSADDVNFETDIAEALARIPRFTGHVRSGAYSVAQHCVVGAHAVYRETKRRDVAAAFLLHDAHEAYIGDIATPTAEALAAYGGLIALNNGGTDAAGKGGMRLVEAALKLLKRRLDAAIHDAAGIIYPLPDEVREAVKIYDLRMLATERRHLLARCTKPWNAAIESAQPLRLEGKLKVWPWAYAADAYRSALDLYAPTALRRAA
jgi:hypothetical protein